MDITKINKIITSVKINVTLADGHIATIELDNNEISETPDNIDTLIINTIKNIYAAKNY